MIDVVQLVKDKKTKFEFAEVISEHNGYKLYIKVFRDSMKFDDIPPLMWNFQPPYGLGGSPIRFNGVRLPASAHQLQEIADLTDCMLLTPKVNDLIWLQAKLKFDCITAVNGKIVAVTNIHDIHQAIENKILSLGGDDGTKLVASDGKYWCLINDLLLKADIAGDKAACNYGWYAKKASGPGIDSTNASIQVWQRPGFAHNKRHWDPSQTIRLMHRTAKIVYPNDTETYEVDLNNIANDAALAPLLHHQPGILKCLRQPGVTKLDPIYQKLTRKELLDTLFTFAK